MQTATPMMDSGEYSDQEFDCSGSDGADSADINEYDIPKLKRRRVLDPYQVARRQEVGEALDRDEVRELLGATTDTSIRRLAVPEICKPYGLAFGSLASVLLSSRGVPVIVETRDGQRVHATVRDARRDLSLECHLSSNAGAASAWGAGTGPASSSSASSSSEYAGVKWVPGIDVAAVRFPHGTHVATLLNAHLRDAQAKTAENMSGRAKRALLQKKRAGKGGRAMAAEHAPVGLSGR